MRHILRLLVSPFILGLLLVTYNYHVVRRLYLFLRWGGEWINYTKEDKVTIQMIYEHLLANQFRPKFPEEKPNT